MLFSKDCEKDGSQNIGLENLFVIGTKFMSTKIVKQDVLFYMAFSFTLIIWGSKAIFLQLYKFFDNFI